MGRVGESCLVGTDSCDVRNLPAIRLESTVGVTTLEGSWPGSMQFLMSNGWNTTTNAYQKEGYALSRNIFLDFHNGGWLTLTNLPIVWLGADFLDWSGTAGRSPSVC